MSTLTPFRHSSVRGRGGGKGEGGGVSHAQVRSSLHGQHRPSRDPTQREQNLIVVSDQSCAFSRVSLSVLGRWDRCKRTTHTQTHTGNVVILVLVTRVERASFNRDTSFDPLHPRDGTEKQRDWGEKGEEEVDETERV